MHFIGIGGISMSGLAEIMLKQGFFVSGSDMNDSHITKKLRLLGATVHHGHSAEYIDGADLVVYTAAVKSDNPEMIAAQRLGIYTIERPVLLGALMRGYANSICVAGTHGKTTTTSMMSHVLMAANSDPTILIGGELDLIGGNIRAGANGYFLTEACEYHESFLQFSPNIAIITNVEADHLDYFRDLEHIKDTFAKFAKIPGAGGFVVVCGDDENTMDCVQDSNSNILSYGIHQKNTVKPLNLRYQNGYGVYDIEYAGELISIKLGVPGEHNVLNSLACVAAGMALGLSGTDVACGISEFVGVDRRFQKKGELYGASIIDDYAHHPTEIKCTLASAANIAQGRVIVVFQPHTYSRTLLLLDEFATAFDNADEIIITDIYAAREPDNGMIHATDLAEKLAGRGKSVSYISSFEDIAKTLLQTIKAGDMVITMGAGNVNTIGDMLLTL